MAEDQPKELGAGQRTGLHFSGFAVLVAEGDLTVTTSDDVLFLNDAFIQIAPKIDQRLVAAADGLDVDDPGFGDRNLLPAVSALPASLWVVAVRQVNPRFDQMRGVAVTKTVRANLFLIRNRARLGATSFARRRDPAAWSLDPPYSSRRGDWETAGPGCDGLSRNDVAYSTSPPARGPVD
jgi:hypothetical protein